MVAVGRGVEHSTPFGIQPTALALSAAAIDSAASRHSFEMSMPTPLQPYLRHAATSTRPSPQPMSSNTSPVASGRKSRKRPWQGGKVARWRVGGLVG